MLHCVMLCCVQLAQREELFEMREYELNVRLRNVRIYLTILGILMSL